MTKRVVVMNADANSNVIVVVEQWADADDGSSMMETPAKRLENPSDMAEFFVHSGNHLRVYELPK